LDVEELQQAFSLAFEDVMEDRNEKTLFGIPETISLAYVMDAEIMVQGPARWDEVSKMWRVPTRMITTAKGMASVHRHMNATMPSGVA
jgi:hypothetical protein